MLSRPSRFLLPLILGAALLAVALASALTSSPGRATSVASKRATVGRVEVAPQIIRSKTRGRLTYLLSRSSRVSVRLQRMEKGRQLSARSGCQRPTTRNRRGKPCTYFGSTVAKRSARGKRGINRLTVRRRFAGKTLRRGLYRATVRARGGSFRQSTFIVK